MTDSNAPILVLGGTGKTGRRVVQRLMEFGEVVRIGSRSAAPAFDWNDRETWASALAGVRAAYITYQPDLATPKALEDIKAFTDLALRNDVRRLVLLSGRGEDAAVRAENALRSSGADWTIIRASWFAQNFSEDMFLDAIRAGVVALPSHGVKEPFIDVEDIADIAAAALTEDGHGGKLYEVTGPDLLTFPEAVAAIAEASGRSIRFEPIPLEDFTAMLRSHGLPEDTIDLLKFLFETVLDGRNAHITDGVQQALGRNPRRFSDFVQTVAKSKIWSEAA